MTAANDNERAAAVEDRSNRRIVAMRERTLRAVIAAALVVVVTGLLAMVGRAVPPEGRIAAVSDGLR